MKDIGAKFKEAREYIGIKLEEAASDMQITVAQLENLEDGNANAFKDIFFLKDLIKKYAKYLNLDEDKIIDEFNDFVFNFTSRIPVSEIEEKVKEIRDEEKSISGKKISSPYTSINIIKTKFNPVLLYIISVFLVITVILLILAVLNNR